MPRLYVIYPHGFQSYLSSLVSSFDNRPSRPPFSQRFYHRPVSRGLALHDGLSRQAYQQP